MPRKYLRDAVTGRPYDPVTKAWLDEQLISRDAVSGAGDYNTRAMQRVPTYANIVRERAREAAAHVDAPPAGFAADPVAWLAELRAANFTPEQVAYLRSNAIDQYEAAQATARDPLADQIIAVWRAWLADNPAALNPTNPFGV